MGPFGISVVENNCVGGGEIDGGPRHGKFSEVPLEETPAIGKLVSVAKVRNLIGAFGFHRKLIENFAKITAPLRKYLTSNKCHC